MRILVATDGSNDAKTAVEWVRHLPLPADPEVLVLTVVDPPIVPLGPDIIGELRTVLIADARRLADDTASELLMSHGDGTRRRGRPARGDRQGRTDLGR